MLCWSALVDSNQFMNEVRKFCYPLIERVSIRVYEIKIAEALIVEIKVGFEISHSGSRGAPTDTDCFERFSVVISNQGML